MLPPEHGACPSEANAAQKNHVASHCALCGVEADSPDPTHKCNAWFAARGCQSRQSSFPKPLRGASTHLPVQGVDRHAKIISKIGSSGYIALPFKPQKLLRAHNDCASATNSGPSRWSHSQQQLPSDGITLGQAGHPKQGIPAAWCRPGSTGTVFPTYRGRLARCSPACMAWPSPALYVCLTQSEPPLPDLHYEV